MSTISFLIVCSLWTNPDLYLLILGISPPKTLWTFSSWNIPHLDSADCSFPFLRLLIFLCCAGGCRGSFPLSLPFSDSLPSILGRRGGLHLLHLFQTPKISQHNSPIFISSSLRNSCERLEVLDKTALIRSHRNLGHSNIEEEEEATRITGLQWISNEY